MLAKGPARSWLLPEVANSDCDLLSPCCSCDFGRPCEDRPVRAMVTAFTADRCYPLALSCSTYAEE